MKYSIRLATVLAFTLALAGAAAAQQVTVDPSIPAYTATKGVSGSLKSVGSDTMNNEMTLWAEGFKGLYPNVQVEVEAVADAAAAPSEEDAAPRARASKKAVRGKTGTRRAGK